MIRQRAAEKKHNQEVNPYVGGTIIHLNLLLDKPPQLLTTPVKKPNAKPSAKLSKGPEPPLITTRTLTLPASNNEFRSCHSYFGSSPHALHLFSTTLTISAFEAEFLSMYPLQQRLFHQQYLVFGYQPTRQVPQASPPYTKTSQRMKGKLTGPTA